MSLIYVKLNVIQMKTRFDTKAKSNSEVIS